MRWMMLCLAAAAAFAAVPANADETPATLTRACDLAAANTNDQARPADVPGVALAGMDARKAIAACEAAAAAAPENPRLLLQTGRAFFAMKDYDKAREFYERAAGRGYAAAQFALATLYEKGLGGAPKDIAAIVATLRSQLARCWSAPAGTRDSRLVVTVRIALNKDGSLAGEPTAVPSGHGPLSNAVAASALRAVRTCQPFRLPSALYEMWREVEVRFDTGYMPDAGSGNVRRAQ